MKLPLNILCCHVAAGASLGLAEGALLALAQTGRLPLAFDLRAPARRFVCLRIWPGCLPWVRAIGAGRTAPPLPDFAAMFRELFPGDGEALPLRDLLRALSCSRWHVKHLTGGVAGLCELPRPRRQRGGSDLHYSQASVLGFLKARQIAFTGEKGTPS